MGNTENTLSALKGLGLAYFSFYQLFLKGDRTVPPGVKGLKELYGCFFVSFFYVFIHSIEQFWDDLELDLDDLEP